MNDEDRVPLSLTAGEYRKLYGEPCPVGHTRLRAWAADGQLPAVRGADGRWTMRRGDIARIREIAPRLLKLADDRMRHRTVISQSTEAAA